MEEEYTTDNAKKQQIDKIFQVIDKNKDNKEICKIAFDTLYTKCLENPALIFPILSNFISLISKCNLKLIQDGDTILLNFFEDFGPKEMSKIIQDTDIKKNILNILKEGNIDYPLFFNPHANRFEKLFSLEYMTMDIFNSHFDINKYANLLREESNINNKMQIGSYKSEELYSKTDIDLLFHNDQKLRKELLESLSVKKINSEGIDIDSNSNKKNKDNKIPVDEIYKLYSKSFDMKFSTMEKKEINERNRDETDLGDESRKKMRKLNNDNKEISIIVSIYPFIGFIREFLQYNHMPYYIQRICSITIIKLLEKQFEKLLYNSYELKINFLANYTDIISVNVIDKTKNSKNLYKDKVKECIQMDMMAQLFLNSVLDKVSDLSSQDCICLLKDLNLKLLSSIIHDFSNEKIKKDFYQKTILLLKQFCKDEKEWQPIFAVLTLYKYISLNSDIVIFLDYGLFNIISDIIDIDSEEIRNLIIKILDKSLESEMIIKKVDKKIIFNIFSKFINLIKKFDDIDIGVKDYFSCLYNFTNYFRNFQNEKEICFQKLESIFKNDAFILHSLNKMINVRIKFFEVVDHLIMDGFYFDKETLEKFILIAFQGICIEEDKLLIKTQRIFLMNVLTKQDKDPNGNDVTSKNACQIIKNNTQLIFSLLLTKNITDENELYYPIQKENSKALINDLYKSFFLNDVQQEEINKKYEQKLTNLIPILALVIRIDTSFIESIYKYFGLQFPISINEEEVANMVLNPTFLLFLRIILFYLSCIQVDLNKTLICNDDILQYLSEISNLKEMIIEVEDENKSKILINNVNNLITFSSETLKEIPNSLREIKCILKNNNQIPIRSLNESMKDIYVKTQNLKNEQKIKKCCEIVKKIKDIILEIEKIQNTNELRLKIRGYASACLFMHSLFKGIKTAKITAITNSFLNCLKINNKESKIFVDYLLSLLSTVDNQNTYNKIIFTFFENSIKMCQDLNINANTNTNTINTNKFLQNNNEFINNLKNFKCLPMKYFFKVSEENKQFLNAQIIISNYIQNLKEKKDEKIFEKVLILLFLLPPKCKLNVMEQDQFISLLKNIIPVLSDNPEYIFYLSNIIFNGENYFINYNMKVILSFLFNLFDNKNIAVFKLVNSLFDNNTISIDSIDYIFTVLSFINSPNEEIRKTSTSIFSKQMKIISILKFSDNYSQIVEKNSDHNSLQFISNIFNQNINDMKEIKIKLKIKLRHYQLIGINWLLFLGNYGLGLALCDDMGLGKTIQTLVAVAESSIEYKKKIKTTPINIIICPNTLIMNWMFESKKFFDDETMHIENDLEKLNKNKNFNSQVIIYICSYEKARDNYNEIFANKNFYYLILDEAHIIKNPKTKMYQSIKKISAEKRIILTGTPIQNNVMELWALFDFLMPGFLGSENDFEIKYHKKMAQNIKKLNLQEDVQENIFQTSLQEIRKRIKPFILRRLKNDVLRELPEKIISDYNCEMQGVQKELYEKYNVMYNNNKLNTEKSPLSVIDKLRKICDHPYLLDINEKKLKTNQDKEEMINNSGKLKALEELLISLGFDSAMQQNKSCFASPSYENKLLIFSQMTKMCTLLEIFLQYKFPGLNILLLTGDAKPKERGGIVLKFNNDPSINVLILTTNIGGLGLNLTSANIVIMYDHNWNPSKDMQAIDRAHRLGQKKIVQVFRLITVNSIEEQLISLQTFKKYISNNVVDTSKIHEDKININSVMQSFEEFSNDRMKATNKDVKKKKVSKLEEFTFCNEEDEKREEMEIAYLHKLIEK